MYNPNDVFQKQMLAVYNFLHERMIEKAKDVKVMQTMYRE